MKSAGRNKRLIADDGAAVHGSESLPPVFHPEQRLRAEVVFALTGWRRSKLYSEIRAGRFPAPERDGKRCSRWRAGDVLLALQQRRAVPA